MLKTLYVFPRRKNRTSRIAQRLQSLSAGRAPPLARRAPSPALEVVGTGTGGQLPFGSSLVLSWLFQLLYYK